MTHAALPLYEAEAAKAKAHGVGRPKRRLVQICTNLYPNRQHRNLVQTCTRFHPSRQHQRPGRRVPLYEAEAAKRMLAGVSPSPNPEADLPLLHSLSSDPPTQVISW